MRACRSAARRNCRGATWRARSGGQLHASDPARGLKLHVPTPARANFQHGRQNSIAGAAHSSDFCSTASARSAIPGARAGRDKMQSLYFLAFVIAILVVVHWAWKNDKIGPTGKSTGILRMTAMEE